MELHRGCDPHLIKGMNRTVLCSSMMFYVYIIYGFRGVWRILKYACTHSRVKEVDVSLGIVRNTHRNIYIYTHIFIGGGGGKRKAVLGLIQSLVFWYPYMAMDHGIF